MKENSDEWDLCSGLIWLTPAFTCPFIHLPCLSPGYKNEATTPHWGPCWHVSVSLGKAGASFWEPNLLLLWKGFPCKFWEGLRESSRSGDEEKGLGGQKGRWRLSCLPAGSRGTEKVSGDSAHRSCRCPGTNHLGFLSQMVARSSAQDCRGAVSPSTKGGLHQYSLCLGPWWLEEFLWDHFVPAKSEFY